MPIWLHLAKGPFFRFTLAVLILGLLRLTLLALLGMLTAIRSAGDRKIPYSLIFQNTLRWMIPAGYIHRTRALYSFASYGLHLGILAAGLFLANHIEILGAATGISWIAIRKSMIDILTLVGIACGFYLLLYRIYIESSRKLSNGMDYLLLILLLNIFLSGYIAGRPWNPFPYDGLMLFHTMNGSFLLISIPFTKIAHCILFPLIRLSSELGWRLRPRGGSEVVEALYGPEGRRI